MKRCIEESDTFWILLVTLTWPSAWRAGDSCTRGTSRVARRVRSRDRPARAGPPLWGSFRQVDGGAHLVAATL